MTGQNALPPASPPALPLSAAGGATRRRQSLATGFGCLALVAFLGGTAWGGAVPPALRAGLWVAVVALALAAWGLALARGGAARAEAETGPSPADGDSDAIAALLRAKTAAEAANAAKTRYLVAVSHEIRSPLNAIYGYAQLLERGGTVSADEAGGAIRRSAEHLTNLVEGLLEISRIESGVVKLRADVVQLPHMLDHVIGMFRMQAEAKGLALAFSAQGRVPTHVRTDEKRLRQILINLLSNAIKYTEAGAVTLLLTYRSQVATIEIVDTGIGIPVEDLERVFEPFERGSTPAAARQPGIGLGLAITRMLTQVLGGELVATSVPGEGSRFRLRLFLPEPAEAPGPVVPDRQVSGYEGARRTILVIDDDPAQTALLDSLLRGLGFVVYTAGNGAEGLALAAQCRPDLVLLDIQMPGADGWDTADTIRQTCGEATGIIMVSANVHDAHKAGANTAFVAKPVELAALLAEIGARLGLSWDRGGAVAAPIAPPPAPLPEEARVWTAEIRRLARVGHIRAVEAAVADLEAHVPASAAAVAIMRDHMRAFDLRALVKMIDGQS